MASGSIQKPLAANANADAAKSGQDAAGTENWPLNQLYFYVTDTCNLRCRHCWIEPRFDGTGEASGGIDAGLFESILDQAKPLGLSAVKLTGGEPLLHRQIDRLIDAIHARELRLSMETNGTLCTPELSRRLAACPNVFVSVSLDSPDAAMHDQIRGRQGSFHEAVAGIKHLVASGIRPQIIMTIMRGNQGQIEDLVKLADSLGAASVKFNILQPTARGKKLSETGETLEIRDWIALGRWVDNDLSPRTALSLIFHQPPAFRGLSRMFGACGDGCHSCGILGILGVLADGSYALCGIGTSVPELIFGHAARDPLREVWLNHPALKEIRSGMPDKLGGVCGRCFLKGICLGSCLAQNYYRQGNIWAPFWYCEEALRQGLFPESRLSPDDTAGNL